EDSLSSGGSDSDESVYKVLLLGAPGVGKSALARIFGGVEDGPEAEAAGHTYDRSIVVDGEEASLMVYDIWEQDGGRWLPSHCMAMGDAYVIVYSVTDKGSFEKASELRAQTLGPSELPAGHPQPHGHGQIDSSALRSGSQGPVRAGPTEMHAQAHMRPKQP
ncbi:RRAD isoform 4, partial [Pan troglodytes]